VRMTLKGIKGLSIAALAGIAIRACGSGSD
jgi:hypothetical protein